MKFCESNNWSTQFLDIQSSKSHFDNQFNLEIGISGISFLQIYVLKLMDKASYLIFLVRFLGMCTCLAQNTKFFLLLNFGPLAKHSDSLNLKPNLTFYFHTFPIEEKVSSKGWKRGALSYFNSVNFLGLIKKVINYGNRIYKMCK